MSNLFNTEHLGGVNIFTYSNETEDVSTLINQALVDYYDKTQVDFRLGLKVDKTTFDLCYNEVGSKVFTVVSTLRNDKLGVLKKDTISISLKVI